MRLPASRGELVRAELYRCTVPTVGCAPRPCYYRPLFRCHVVPSVSQPAFSLPLLALSSDASHREHAERLVLVEDGLFLVHPASTSASSSRRARMSFGRVIDIAYVQRCFSGIAASFCVRRRFRGLAAWMRTARVSHHDYTTLLRLRRTRAIASSLHSCVRMIRYRSPDSRR